MDNPATSVPLITVIDPPWTEVSPIRLGAVPSGLGTPDLFALVTLADQSLGRLDLYRAAESELYVRDEVIAWHGWLVVGFGHRVFLIHALDRYVRELPIPLYCERFRTADDYLLILAGHGLVRVDSQGQHVWTNDRLAIDGIEVDSIENGVIRGKGDWNPPGGGRPFRVRLETGQLIDHTV